MAHKQRIRNGAGELSHALLFSPTSPPPPLLSLSLSLQNFFCLLYFFGLQFPLRTQYKYTFSELYMYSVDQSPLGLPGPAEINVNLHMDMNVRLPRAIWQSERFRER
jgi:hypothetical protein